MEEKQARFNVAGVLRLLLGVIIVVIVAFLLVRFISVRRTDDGGANTSDTTVNQQGNEGANQESDESATDNGSESADSQTQNDNSAIVNDDDSASIPSGFEDSPVGSSDTESSQSEALPEAGMGENVLIVAAILTLGTYTLVRATQKAYI